jgi:ABC-2 type transport system ATP-binding protein
MIEVRDLHKRFGAVEAVRGVSFRVERGEIVGFLGPNGAGKTTTMRVLTGVFPPTSGEVRIAGRDVMRDSLACRRAIGYFPEFAPHYPELSVVGYLRFVARLKRIERARQGAAVDAVVETCGLAAVARRRVGTLSKGFRQRLGLAQALCGDPPVLILDEPTVGLDPGQVVEIRALIHALRGDRTVLFSSHVLSEVEAVCARVIVIARGRVVGEGTPADLGSRLGRRQRVVVRLDAAPVEVAAALAEVAGVLEVTAVAGAWHLDAPADEDVTGRVADLAQRRGWRLRELREEVLALEEIFLELVRDDRPPS